MNNILPRKQIPQTPNLQDRIKKKSSKSKTKNNLQVQGSNPPTPKIYKPSNMHQYSINSKFGNEKAYSVIKPELTSNYDRPSHIPNFIDQEKYQKKLEIQGFKQKVNLLQEKLIINSNQLKRNVDQQQTKFHQNCLYIKETYENLRAQLDEKERQLTNKLHQSQHSLKRLSKSNLLLLDDIKASLERYLFDINKNYDDIINQLSLDQFLDIMSQYNRKIDFFKDHVEKLANVEGVSVYVPVKETERIIAKGNVEGLIEDDLFEEKKLFSINGSKATDRADRYESEKNNAGKYYRIKKEKYDQTESLALGKASKTNYTSKENILNSANNDLTKTTCFY